ncbi:MAG: twin-arginine translocation signal domain-containing protein [Bacteroidetes bacterium]|nr:MAG: twin-arginine translocation signal domain-containing protein [Bacteroidota bacterium]
MNKDNQHSRRRFLQTSAVVGAGLAASQLPLSASAHVLGDDTIKVGLIGCGGRGTGAAVQALSTKENVQLVAMADAFRDRLNQSYTHITKEIKDASRIAVPEEHKFVGFDAYKEVIKLADVVILTTPPGFRPIHFEAAIAADKHVFMEKPLATDAPGVRKVLETAKIAKEKKLNVVVGLQRHYQTVYREWIKRIHAGVIGDITSSAVYWNSGGVWVRPRQPGQTEMEYQMRNWYYFNWLCGDHINEQHIHNLDVSNWVMNGYPVRAQGMGGRQVRTGKEYGEIFDHHFVEFEYANGAKTYSQCRHIKGCMNRVSESFQGTRGTAPKPGLLTTLNGFTIWEHRGKNDPNPYQVEHDELFAAIANGEYKYADAFNGAKSTMTAIMGRMATYSGQIIEWDEALNSELSLMPARFAWDADPPVLPNEDGFYPVPMPGKTKVLSMAK